MKLFDTPGGEAFTGRGRVEFVQGPDVDELMIAIRAALEALGNDPQAELRIYKARTILNQALKA